MDASWLHWQWRAVDRLKVEILGKGLSLRKVDETFPVGQRKRHKLQKSKGRQIPIGDILEILKAADIDPAKFFGQLAGQGDPLEVAAIRGPRAAKWTKRQRRVLAAVKALEERGAAGFEDAREELRQLELLRDENVQAADNAAWAWLEQEKRPGVVVGLLAFLAVGALRSNAHRFLQLAGEVLGGELRSAAGGKLATASGRCFIQVGLVAEGLSILQNFALSITSQHGDNDDEASALFQLAKAAAILGDSKGNEAALRKAASIGSAHLRFAARQLLAYQELNLGNFHLAARMYAELVRDVQFHLEPRKSRVSVTCSQMTSRFLAGELTSESAVEFMALVEEAKDVLTPNSHVSMIIDLAVFLGSVARTKDAKRVLEAELWNAIDLEDSGIQQKFAELWEKFGLPRDTRLQTLIARAAGCEPLAIPKNQPPGS